MAGDRPLIEFADRLRAGANRLLYRRSLAERQALLERCTRFDRASLLATPLAEARFVVIDTETTGLQAYAGDEIIQIALLEYQGLQPTGREFVSLVHPARPIPAESTAIHGIDDAMVATAPVIDHLIDDIVDFIGHAVVVGHHVAFDLRFLNRVMHRSLFCRLPQPEVDTMLLYLEYSGRFGHYGLEEVAAACNIDIERRHDARADAVVCGRIFARLVGELIGDGADVAKLLAITRLAPADEAPGQPAL